MIRIWTDKSLIDSTCDYFEDCDAFVRALVTSKEFSDRDIEAIQQIDNARMIDRNNNWVLTRFGATNIENLSSGCKTVLTYLHIIRHKNIPSKRAVINITMCGVNALNMLFKYAEEDNRDDIVFFLGYLDRLGGCMKTKYLVNNKEVVYDLSLLR